MIKFENVCLKYPNFEIKNLNFEIQDGEIVAIIGNNASGKTTVLNLAGGLSKQKKGNIFVDGKKPICGQNLGMVFSSPDNQIIFSIVEEDIIFTLKNHKVPKNEWKQRISEALALVHLNGFEKHETSTLSAGQKQRLVIANMLATKPKILLLDEVSNYLDEAAKKELFKLFGELKKMGITLVFATNVLDEIVFADKVMVLDNGEIKSFKSTKDTIFDLEIFKQIGMEISLKIKILNKLKRADIKFDEEIFAELEGRLK